MKLFTPLLLSVIALAAMLIACEKDDDTNPNQQSIQPEQEAEAREVMTHDFLYDEAERIAEQAIAGDLQLKTHTPLTCATLTIDTNSNPRTAIIDFGPTNCTGLDGRVRRGKILASWTVPRWQNGSTLTLSFDDYHVDNNGLFGTRTTTFNGVTNNMPSQTISTQGGMIDANGDSTYFASNRDRVMTSGFGTPSPQDDVFSISGTAQGYTANGVNWTMTITNPLLWPVSCPHIVSGTFTMQSPGSLVRTLDYGAGACDNLATLTIANQSTTITLP